VIRVCDKCYADRKLYTIDELNKLRRSNQKLIKESNNLQELEEMTLKDLKQGADKDIIRRAKEQNLGSYYQGITSGGVLEFETKAITTEGKSRWEQEIKLLDLDDAIEATKLDNMTDRDIVDLAIYGDISVYCDCPSFKWHGYQYIAWQMDYGLRRQTHAPDTRNPERKGTVCKHLYNVFTVMPMHINKIVSDLRDLGIF
jgi:hypothetical protein